MANIHNSAVLQLADAVEQTVVGLLGTRVPTDTPLMGAGLDSMAATELV